MASTKCFILPILILLAASHCISATPSHFVLVHGFGHGAWCWYKPITLLRAAGHLVTAIDLTSNGNSKVVADTVSSVAEYTKPLTDFLAHNITSHKQVVLVGHSLGGSSITYAMELFPYKISKAIFLASSMPSNGESFVSPQLASVTVALTQAGVIVQNFADGPSAPATSAYLNLTQAKYFFYNKSPAQDVNLAYTCLNPTPTRLQTTFNLTSTNYGSIRRFYIITLADHVVPPSIQQIVINQNPPERVFNMTSDHSPFFSKPMALVRNFLYIASL